MPVWEPDAQPRTILVPGEGTQSLSFTVPPGVALGFESVVASVDAAGADSLGLLTITAPGGETIAAIPQTDPIPAGDAGFETWAVGIRRQQASTSTSLGVATWGASGGTPANQTLTSGAFATIFFAAQGTFVGVLTYNNGDPFYSESGPAAGQTDTVTIIEQGLYLVQGFYSHGGAAGNYKKQMFVVANFPATYPGQQITQTTFDTDEAENAVSLVVGVTAADAAGGVVSVAMQAFQNSGANKLRGGASLTIVRLSPTFP